MIKLIPKDAPVCACTLFVPHLATRDKIYTYPLIFDCEYLLLNRKSWTYSEDDYKLLDIIINKEPDKWAIVKEYDDLRELLDETLNVAIGILEAISKKEIKDKKEEELIDEASF